MPTPNPLRTPELEFKSLLVLVLAATLLFALIIWPFFGAVCWAVFLAIVFWPLHQRFLQATKGRHGWAALASLLLILVIVILPMALIAVSITEEASVLVERMRSGEIQIGIYFQKIFDALPGWAHGILDRFGMSDLDLMQTKAMDLLGSSSQALTTRVVGIGAVTLDFVVAFFVMVYVLYFLFRDGEKLSAGITRKIPLRSEHTGRLLRQFARVVRATVKGNVVVALVQGALGGAAFFVLGVPGAVLWGAVMALLSLLPAIGAVLVWAPVALYFFFAGDLVRAVGLTFWGAVVIGLVDNFLRPILVGKDTRMPDYLILVATLGGLVVFGLNGFVIGPVIAAVFLVSWDMLAKVRDEADETGEAQAQAHPQQPPVMAPLPHPLPPSAEGEAP